MKEENIVNDNINIEINTSAEYDDEFLGCGNEVTRMVGFGITIVEVIMVVLAIMCILKGILNILYNKKINKVNENKEKNEIEENTENEKKDETIKTKVVGPCFIAAGFMLFIKFMLNIVQNFAAKPIIYIYPEEETKVKVKVSDPKKLTCTYPKYEDGWEVLAKPNGDLVDLKTNRNLYALYWEGINNLKLNLKEGFIVESKNVAKFLEEKLEILGLNEREAEEFIVYWLPLMEKNKYNYIRFETIDEINENLKLEITPEPETLIRINMEFKGLSKPIDVEEQKLEKVERKGYTVVEWGGTKL